MKLDEDHDGSLTMKELIPIVFSKASRDQMMLITKYCQAHLSKSLDSDAAYKLPQIVIDQLFGE